MLFYIFQNHQHRIQMLFQILEDVIVTHTLLNTFKDAEKPCYTLHLSTLNRWFEWIRTQYQHEQGRRVHELVKSSESRTRTLVLASRWNVPAQQPQNIGNNSMQNCHITNYEIICSRQKLFHISQTRLRCNSPSARRVLHSSASW